MANTEGTTMATTKGTPVPVRIQVEYPERPTFQYRGSMLTIEAFDILRNGQFTLKDLLLAVTIDAYTDARSKRGCWATNNHLAEAIKVEKRSVPRMIAKLIKANLVHSVVVDGERQLFTTWGVVYKQTHDRAVKGGMTARSSRRREEKLKKKRGEAKPATRVVATPPKKQSTTETNNVLLNDIPATPVRQSTPTTADMERADKLKRIVQSRHNGALPYPKSRTKWIDQLRLLRTEDKVPEADIDAVLDWYGSATAEPWSISCGCDFRRSFPILRDKMNKAKRKNPATPISDDARKLATRLTDVYLWPRGCGKDLAATIQMSIDRFKAFQERFKTYHASLVRGDALREFIRRRIYPAYWDNCDPWDNIEIHFDRVNKRIHGWADWSGDLFMFAWGSNTKETIAEMRGLFEDWFGGEDWSKLWDRFKREVLDVIS